jgi:hypothetical protein
VISIVVELYYNKLIIIILDADYHIPYGT